MFCLTCHGPLRGSQKLYCRDSCKKLGWRRKRRGPRLCQTCQVELPRQEAHKGSTKYCSDPCRKQAQKVAWQKANQKNRKYKASKCLVCGLPVQGRRTTYCSTTCYKAQLTANTVQRRLEAAAHRLATLECEECGGPRGLKTKRFCAECALDLGAERARIFRAKDKVILRPTTGPTTGPTSDGECHWCFAFRSEKRFAQAGEGTKNFQECTSCERQRLRAPCLSCGGPTMKARCIRCDPAPAGFFPVFLLNDTDLREKTVWLKIRGLPGGRDKRHRTYPRGYVKAGRYRFRPRTGLTITVPLEVWRHIRI